MYDRFGNAESFNLTEERVNGKNSPDHRGGVRREGDGSRGDRHGCGPPVGDRAVHTRRPGRAGEVHFGEFVVGPGDDTRSTSPYYKTVRLPVEISFTTDPEELDDRQDEPAPTKESLLTWLQDALVLQVDTEDHGQPEGAVFAAAGVDWNAAVLVEGQDSSCQ